MPWTFGAGGAKAKKKTAKKKAQSRKPSRGMGRRLLNAGMAELMREEREADERKKAAEVKPAGGTKREAPPPRRLVKTSVAPLPSKPAAAAKNSQIVARRQEFLRFLNETPTASYGWRTENGVSDTPSGLGKHIKESVLVFSFKTEEQGGLTTWVLGATMYRRNNRKKDAPLDRQCQVVIRLRNAQITHKWTDWSPNADGSRMRPGIFVFLFRDYMAKAPKNICVLANENDLRQKDAECGLDWRHDYSHYVFAENEFFPPSSGW